MPPLDLIKEKHPAIMESSASDLFVRETFKVAVKAYLAALGDHPDDNQWVDKAQGVIQQMRDDAAVSNDPQAQAKIVVIYRMIASQLKEQLGKAVVITATLEPISSAVEFIGFPGKRDLFDILSRHLRGSVFSL